MKEKDDWKELEEWEQNRRANEKDKYGINIQDIKPQKIKWIDKIVKVLRSIGIVYVIIATIIFILALIAVGLYLYAKFSSIKSQLDIDLIGTIESMYNIKTDIVSQDTDDRGNGKYTIKLKDSDINLTFNAIKDHGNFNEDYVDNCQKYYFDKWQSKTKENFKVGERVDGSFLSYENFIEINNYDELISAVNSINEFYEYSKNNLFAGWDVYIKYNNSRIYPYTSSSNDEEDAMNNAKQQFENIINKK